MRQLILDTITDAVTDLLCYDRIEDEELGVGDIDLAVADGDITVNEIVEHFRAKFTEGLATA